MGDRLEERPAIASAPSGHEVSDVRIRPLAVFLAGLAVSLGLVALFAAWLFRMFLGASEAASRDSAAVGATINRSAGPLLQVSPRRDLELLRRREDNRLHALEWVDRERGILTIPIERAIDLAAEREFPNWPKVETASPNSGDQSRSPPESPP